MKVLHIHGGRTADVDLLLHPRLTVVRGMHDPARQWLIDSVGNLAVGRAGNASGELEASGIRFGLTDTSLSILGLLVAHRAVISSADLLAVGLPDPGAAGATTDAGEGLDEPRGLPAEAPDAISAGALVTAEPAVPAPAVPEPAEPEVSEPDPETVRVLAAIDARSDALRRRRNELRQVAEQIPHPPVDEVTGAVEELEQAPVGAPVAGAAEAADRWRDLHRELQAIELGTTADERAAMAELTRAEGAVAEAEAILRQPQLTDEVAAKIEAAHNAYLEATDRAERRFGSARARKAVAEAEAEEARLLDRHGYDSWVDYLMSASKRAVDPDRKKEREALEEARREVEHCTADLDALPGAVARRRRRADLAVRLDALSAEVAELLGHQPVGDQVEEELRALRVRADRSREVSRLIGALRAAGADLPASVTPATDADEVLGRARQFLDLASRDAQRRKDLETAIAALDVHIDALDEARSSDDPAMPELAPLPDMAEPPRSLLDLAEPLPEPDPEPEAQVEVGPEATEDRELPASTEVEADPDRADDPALRSEPEPLTLLGPLDRLDHQLPVELAGGSAAAPVASSVAELTVDEVIWRMLVVMATARSDGPAGHLPVVLDDPFDDLAADAVVEVLNRLMRFSDLVQLVVVSDRPEIATWAHSLGPETARVVG